MGNKCVECDEFHRAGWPHLSFEEFVEHSCGAGKAEVDEARDVRAGGERSFLQDEVQGECRHFIQVSTSMIVVDKGSEYRACFGRNMTSRSPKVPTMTLPPSAPGQHGEAVFCSANPLQPFRVVNLVREWGDSRKTSPITPEQHLYEKHGQ